MSTITDDRTPNLNLPLPYAQNQLSDDVERLRQAMTILDTEFAKKATTASPTFTGDPKAPTPASTDNDTSVATTAFVRAAMALFGIGNNTNAPLMADLEDTTLGAGLYTTSSSVLNPPPQATNTTGFVLHKLYGTAGFQLFSQYGSATLLYRSRASGVWQPWTRVGSDALAALGLGLTTYQPNWPNTSLNNCAGVATGVYRTNGNTTDFPPGYTTHNIVEFYLRDALSAGLFDAVQIVHNVANNKRFMRSAKGTGAADAPAWSAWKEIAATDSPAFTGTPTAPTAAAGTNTTQLATTAFVKTAVAAVDGAAVKTFNGRVPTAGAINPMSGDYDISQVTGGGDAARLDTGVIPAGRVVGNYPVYALGWQTARRINIKDTTIVGTPTIGWVDIQGTSDVTLNLKVPVFGSTGYQSPTYQNSWSDTPGTNMFFTRIGNVVYLSGASSHSSSVTIGMVMFTLPVGYRPARQVMLVCQQFQDTPAGWSDVAVTIDTNGEVKYVTRLAGTSVPSGGTLTLGINASWVSNDF